MEDIDAGVEHTTPVWAVFGDLMSGLLAATALIFGAAYSLWLVKRVVFGTIGGDLGAADAGLSEFLFWS